jgi:hypothetical protein
MFPCLVIANGPWEAAGPTLEREGPVIRGMRLTNSWAGGPAVARPRVCGLVLIELHGAPTAAAGADARSFVAQKPYPARPIEESP